MINKKTKNTIQKLKKHKKNTKGHSQYIPITKQKWKKYALWEKNAMFF